MYADNFKNIEVKKVLDSVRSEVTRLQSEGVNIIIASGHAGIDVDKEIAKLEGVDIVVGAHTETFMYTGLYSHFSCNSRMGSNLRNVLDSNFFLFIAG